MGPGQASPRRRARTAARPFHIWVLGLPPLLLLLHCVWLLRVSLADLRVTVVVRAVLLLKGGGVLWRPRHSDARGAASTGATEQKVCLLSLTLLGALALL